MSTVRCLPTAALAALALLGGIEPAHAQTALSVDWSSASSGDLNDVTATASVDAGVLVQTSATFSGSDYAIELDSAEAIRFDLGRTLTVTFSEPIADLLLYSQDLNPGGNRPFGRGPGRSYRDRRGNMHDHGRSNSYRSDERRSYRRDRSVYDGGYGGRSQVNTSIRWISS
jgi:hypothetical protein